MAEEKKEKKTTKSKKKTKKESFKELKIAYRSLEDPKKFKKTILFPLIGMGVLVFILPFILQAAIPVPLDLNPITFII